MRDHRRIDGREILQRLRVIQLDHRIDGGAAGGDKIFEASFFEQLFVLCGHLARADTGFLRIGKPQPAQSEPHDVEILQAEAGYKRGSDGSDDAAACEKALHLLPLAVHALGVLRADLGAVTAEDAAAVDDLGVVIDHLDGFDRTLAQAFIAVFAAGILEIEIADHSAPRPHLPSSG